MLLLSLGTTLENFYRPGLLCLALPGCSLANSPAFLPISVCNLLGVPLIQYNKLLTSPISRGPNATIGRGRSQVTSYSLGITINADELMK